MSATASEKEIIEQVNILRSNPAGYSSKIESYINYFNGPILKIPEINVQIRTQEGDIPYKETVDFLKNEEPKNPLVPSKALCEIAKEILDKIVDSETGEIDEAEAENIIDKHGSFSGKFTRAMDFGGFTSEQVVINFLVCDGDTDRTQREPLLGKGLKKIGVAFGKHSIYTTVCVLVSCTEFTNTVDSDDTPVFPDPEKLPEEEKKREEEKKKQYEKEKLAEEKKKREEEEKYFNYRKKIFKPDLIYNKLNDFSEKFNKDLGKINNNYGNNMSRTRFTENPLMKKYMNIIPVYETYKDLKQIENRYIGSKFKFKLLPLYNKKLSNIDRLADRFYKTQSMKEGLINLLNIQNSSYDNKK